MVVGGQQLRSLLLHKLVGLGNPIVSSIGHGPKLGSSMNTWYSEQMEFGNRVHMGRLDCSHTHAVLIPGNCT